MSRVRSLLVRHAAVIISGVSLFLIIGVISGKWLSAAGIAVIACLAGLLYRQPQGENHGR